MQTYKELQLNLKAFKESGHVLQVKLNAKKEVLEAELVRLQGLQESELPSIQEVEEEISILQLESVASLTAQYSLAGDTTYVNTTKEEEQLEQQMNATQQLVTATILTERVFDDLWGITEGISNVCVQEVVDVPKCYQLCLPPAPDSTPDISSPYVNPMVVFLSPILVFLLILSLSIKLLNKVLKLSIPFVLQHCKPILTGYYSTRDREPLLT